MKTSFIISKTENQFFFLSNLSDWHFSCRPDYNKAWLVQKGLSEEDKILLNRFKKILSKYGYKYKDGKNQYLGQSFYIPPEHRKWNSVKLQVSSPEYESIRKYFLHFNGRFEKSWDCSLIKKWARAFEREIKKPNVRKMFSVIEGFYGIRLPKYLRVHLIASPSLVRSVAGSANIGPHDIVLEVPIFKLTQWNVEFGVSILAHELIHTIIENSPKLLFLVNSISNKNRKIMNRTRAEVGKELIGELCAPFGYICHKTFTSFESVSDILIPVLIKRDSSFGSLIKRVVWNIYPDVGSYIENNKTIDKNLFSRAVDILEKTHKEGWY